MGVPKRPAFSRNSSRSLIKIPNKRRTFIAFAGITFTT
jgi:hypothetical protein